MRTESSPFGRLLEEFWTTAFKAHPYGEPSIGHMSDIQSYTRAEAVDFFEKYYNPANLIVAIAGDVDPDEIRTLAETYFGRLPEGARPDPVETVEPPPDCRAPRRDRGAEPADRRCRVAQGQRECSFGSLLGFRFGYP